MRKVWILLLGVLVMVSCKKGINYPPNENCITRVNFPLDQVSPADSAAAIALLDQHNIPHKNVMPAYVSIYNVPTGDNAGNYANIFVTQYINGLPVISGDIWYQFYNNVLQSTYGTLYSGYYPNSLPQHSLPQLRTLYFNAVAKNASQQFATSLQDSCLKATLGYYDLNVNLNTKPNLVRAWLIMPEHGSFPHVYLRDDNSAVIIYDAGIVFYDVHKDQKTITGNAFKRQ